MAVTVYLFNFNKKKNSTAQPTLSSGTQLSGEVKEDFTPVAPVITFNLSNPNTVPTYNYAYCADFNNRYYFITNWLYVKGLWRATFACDVLATYKSEILASRQYVARSKSLNSGKLIDASYPTLANSVRQTQSYPQTSLWGTDFEDGTFVLGIVNQSGYNIGAVTYYAFAYTGFRLFMAMLLSGISWANISTSEISEELQKALINPTQYIVSCVWLPINGFDFVVRYDTGTENLRYDVTNIIHLGWWSFSLTGGNVARILHQPTRIADDYVVRTFTFNIPKHSQQSQFGVWLNLAPYSKHVLYFLPFGVFELDSYDICNATSITLEVIMHAFNGDATLRVFVDDPNFPGTLHMILQTSAQVGINIPIGQIALDAGNLESGLIAGAAAGVAEVAAMWSENNASVATKSTPSPHSKTSRRSK